MDINNDLLHDIIKTVLEECMQKENAESLSEKYRDSSGVLRIKARSVKCIPYDVGVPAKVALRDLVTLQESPSIGCGILEIENSCYPWTLTYDEYYYVVNGTLEILIDNRKVEGNEGDILYIPKGSSIQFSSPNHCRAVYFTYPADWENS